MSRQTDFKPSYGDEIMSLMSEGYSLAAAASQLGIHRQRVYDWASKHEEFGEQVKLAMVKRQFFLEKRLLTATTGPEVTSAIFALKNAAPADFREKQEVEHSGPMQVTFTTIYDTDAK
ncbi:helix-turn-helix domain-containing protein [Phyllobacterium lublinensis]|uniref:helix-turn-helix domain-containing protein n=1 Tax=Phyllobacterium lublinensis TaxID=2875708 RepID=UPI001CCBDF7D|nr:helix-turn-helix domain-containing protein [Phyllobacterium sp. 2063]MBZ9654675.1 helix-turn-helix domain-containing protein [Phyllobacterium sp. 2063]